MTVTKCWIDTETFSTTPIKHGTFRYFEAAQLLIIAYAFDDGEVQIVDLTAPLSDWQGVPADLDAALGDPNVLKLAHNVSFDRQALKLAGYDIPIEQWYDTSVQARAHALPGALDKLCEVFGIAEADAKHKEGKALVQLFCKPRPKRSAITRATYATHPEEWEAFKDYAKSDIRAMRALHKLMPKWNYRGAELDLWRLDQKINERGVLCDIELAHAALRAVDTEQLRLSAEVSEATNEEVASARQRDALLHFILKDFGVSLPDLTKSTVERRLEDPDIPEPVKELLRLRLSAATTSTAKYKALLRSISSDNRLRGALQFAGASRTARWCLTGDHEVLTPTGWCRLDAWPGSKIACWAPGGVFSFQDAERVVFPYSGEMVNLSTQRHEQLSTPDHAMPVMTANGFSKQYVRDTKLRRSLLAVTGRRVTEAHTDRDALRILVMTQADGHYTPDALRFHFKKERKVQRCRALLRRGGLVFSETKYKENTLFVIRRRHLPKYLVLFSDKVFGAWLFNECPETFFSELELWGGTRCGPNSIQYSTCSKSNADIVQAFAHLSGLTASILARKSRDENWNVNYAVNVWLSLTESTEVKPRHYSTQAFSGVVYCASTMTGFFLVRRNGIAWITGNSGRIFQPQNLPCPKLKQKFIDAGIEALKAGAEDLLVSNVMGLASSALRGSFIAPQGKRLVVSDLRNIEGRVGAWLANETWKLKAFEDFDAKTGHDLYKLAYAKAFSTTPESVTKPQRQIGKVMELALLYEGGVGAFAAFAPIYGIDLDALADTAWSTIPENVIEEAEGFYKWLDKKGAARAGMSERVFIVCDALKRLWRAAHPNTVILWAALKRSAISAIQQPGVTFTAGRLKFRRDGAWLRMALPSGRCLCYLQPQATDDGAITYMGLNQYTRKWERISTHGGKLLENACQASARDVMGYNMADMEAAGFDILLTVHDEIITEAPDDDVFSAHKLSALLAQNKPWSEGLPLAAEGYHSYRYKKD